jgi:hypothetical protein
MKGRNWKRKIKNAGKRNVKMENVNTDESTQNQ